MLEYVEFISSSSENEDESEESSKGEIDGDDDMDDIDQKVIMKIQRKKSVEKKKEIISLILRFKTRISIIEKEKKSQLYSKSNQQDFSCLEEEEEKMNIDRKNEKQSLKESLKKISLKVETLKKEKASQQKSAAFVERLRVCIEDIELNIMQLKQKQSKIYEELSLNEQKLTSIVSGFEKKFNQWSEKVNKIPKVNSSEEKEDIQLPAEVKDFEDFIKLTGGHQGGWDDFDHNIFLKLRKQFKKDDQLIKIAESEIVTQNRDDIIQHIQWYHEYSKLKERKKQAIFAWKTMKQNNRETALANINDEPFEEDIKRIRREKLFKKEREDRFAGLEQWKKEKANQKLEEETSQKKHNFILNKDKEDQRKLQLKLKVERYKRQKEEEALRLANKKELLNKPKIISLEQKEKILERNEKLITLKKEKQLAKQHEVDEKEKRLEKLKEKVIVNVSRDPTRLFKFTEGLKSRLEKDNEMKASHLISDVKFIPRKCLPSWRKVTT